MDCECKPGYSGPDGGTCVVCLAGSYKDVNGSVACSLCPAGTFSTAKAADKREACVPCGVDTYSTTLGAAAVSTCLYCPAHTRSDIGSSVIANCSCIAGYTGPDRSEEHTSELQSR